MSEVWLTFALKCNNLYKVLTHSKAPEVALANEIYYDPQDDFRIWLRWTTWISPTQNK